MPPNITDVRTIEKMHFAQVQQQQQQLLDNNNCDSVERTNNNNNVGGNLLPAVVIMNGETTTKDVSVSGLEFGFEVNKRLLLDDVSDTFTARFVSPPKVNTNVYNHEKIVNFIGQGKPFLKKKTSNLQLIVFFLFFQLGMM